MIWKSCLKKSGDNIYSINTISNYSKKRTWTVILLLIITPLGFYTKFYSGPAASWVNDSLGGVFYEIFWCLLVFLFFVNTKAWVIAASVFTVTSFLEVLQLWHPEFLEFIRSYFIGRTFLGTSFNLYDFIYYFIGSGIGYLILSRLQKLNKKWVHHLLINLFIFKCITADNLTFKLLILILKIKRTLIFWLYKELEWQPAMKY